MAVIITNDKWMHIPQGTLDPIDQELLKEASGDGEAVVMTAKEAFEAMKKEAPAKFEQFKENVEKSVGKTLTMADLVAMGKQANERYKEFDAIARSMTLEEAKEVRRLRIDERRTWRALARACHDNIQTGQWAWLSAWSPSSNQIAGMALCHHAAKLLGEDFMEPPWN